MPKKTPRVIQPHEIISCRGPRQIRDKWRCDLVLSDGFVTSRQFETKEACIAFINECGKTPTVDQARATAAVKTTLVLEPDGTMRWWRNLLEVMAYKVFMESGSENRNDLKCLASAALSISKIYDQSALEAEIDRLTKQVDEIMLGKRHGLKVVSSES